MREEILMQHDRASVRRLASMQYKTFSGRQRLLWSALALILIALGFGLIVDLGTPWRYIPLALGCLLFVNVGASAELKADRTLRAIQQQGGEFPRTKMVFSERSVLVTEHGGSAHTLPYTRFVRLAEDAEYCYLFITNEAAYMVPLAQIRSRERLRSALEKGSGQRFVRPAGLFSLRLRDLFGRRGA